MAVPLAFCWTRMGDESGENLRAIFRRKELERQGEGGTFLWGIGNGLGDGLTQLVALESEPRVLFSPIRAAAALRDREPSSIVLWLDYIDRNGSKAPLPASSFVTSRGSTAGGSTKTAHYALFCSSLKPLEAEQIGTLQFHELRNLATQKPVGFSQVTAVVSKQAESSNKALKYNVVMSAQLLAPFCARLATPVAIDQIDMQFIDSVASKGDVGLWKSEIQSLKSRLRAASVMQMPQLAFFENRAAL